MSGYLEFSEKIHAEEREVIKKLVNAIEDLNTDELQYKDIVHITEKIQRASSELTGLEKIGRLLLYIEDGCWTDEEIIDRAKRMA